MKFVIITLLILSSPCFADRYALLVNGGYSNLENNLLHNDSIREMYQQLIEQNYYKGNILVLDSDGGDNASSPFSAENPPGDNFAYPADAWYHTGLWNGEDYQMPYYRSGADSPKDYDLDGVADPWGPSTFACFEDAVDELAQRVTSDDSLIIYLVDHGGVYLDDFIFGLWGSTSDKGTWATGTYLAEQLDTIPYDYRIVLTLACHSGAFADNITALGNRTIFMSACDDDELSYSMGSYHLKGGPDDGFWYQGSRGWGSPLIAGIEIGGFWEDIFDYSYDNDLFGPVLGPYVDGEYTYPIETPQFVDLDGIATIYEMAVVEGDADRDGDVDITDLSMLADNWKTSVTDDIWEQGDFDYTDYVDLTDLTVLAANWGYGVSGVVPEPTILMILLGGLFVLRRSR